VIGGLPALLPACLSRDNFVQRIVVECKVILLVGDSVFQISCEVNGRFLLRSFHPSEGRSARSCSRITTKRRGRSQPNRCRENSPTA